VKLEFEIRPEDLRAAVEHHYGTSPAVRKSVGDARFLAALIVVCFAALVALLLEDWTPLPVGVLLALVVWLVSPPGMKTRYLRQAMAAYREGGFVNLVGVRTLELEADGLSFVTTNSSHRYEWNAVVSVRVAPSHVFLYFSSVSLLPIPRATVRSGDFDAVAAALAKRGA